MVVTKRYDRVSLYSNSASNDSLKIFKILVKRYIYTIYSLILVV